MNKILRQRRNVREAGWILLLSLGALATFALVACSDGSDGSDASTGDTTASSDGGPVTVQVALTEFSIESSLDTFQVGVPYHFVIKNEGQANHELMIMAPVQDGMSMDMEEMDAMAIAMVDEDELPSGATQTIDVTFDEPATLELSCHIPGHYQAGMHFPISVVE